MKKIIFDMLSIEVTRRCNMRCAHCLRGNAENKDMTYDTLHTLLNQVAYIEELTFTGGEPTLNLPLIRETLRYCKEKHIDVFDFYLVTNGKQITSEFIVLMVEWYCYCLECGGDPSLNGVALSQDMFHEEIDPKNENMLKALSFYRPDDKRIDFTKWKPVDLGNARSLILPKETPYRMAEIEVSKENGCLHVEDRNILLTATGDVLSDCDYEYNNPDSIYICRAENASETFEKIMSDPHYSWQKRA